MSAERSVWATSLPNASAKVLQIVECTKFLPPKNSTCTLRFAKRAKISVILLTTCYKIRIAAYKVLQNSPKYKKSPREAISLYY